MNTFSKIIICAVLSIVLLLCVVCALIPEKDKYGNYTQPIQYWINNDYFNDNF